MCAGVRLKLSRGDVRQAMHLEGEGGIVGAVIEARKASTYRK
jgi:hypothetical protein